VLDTVEGRVHDRQRTSAARDGARDFGSRGPFVSGAHGSNTGAGSASSGNGKAVTNAPRRKINCRFPRIAGFHFGSILRSRAFTLASMTASSRSGFAPPFGFLRTGRDFRRWLVMTLQP